MNDDNRNMAVWEGVCRPPAERLKKIQGGRISGKSDINPQWRYQVMTEQFGMCGIGWKYTIDRLWTEPGCDGVVFAFAQVSVYVKDPEADSTNCPTQTDYWSAAIPGIGGHKLIVDESKGLYANDEAFKMATTDALGVALKMLGVAADIYLGNFDGSKYLTPAPDEVRQQKQEKESKKAELAKVRADGYAILKVAAEKGETDMRLAWSALSEDMRKACKDDKEFLKKMAQEVDAKKGVNNHADAHH